MFLVLLMMVHNPDPLWATPRNPDRGNRLAEFRKIGHVLGQPLLPWQERFVSVATEVDPATGGPWYKTLVLTVGRQQGKSVLLGYFCFDRMLFWPEDCQRCLWSAQNIHDAISVWEEKLRPLIPEDLLRLGEFHFTLGNAGHPVIYVRARDSSTRIISSSKTAGHGSTVGLAIVDEAWKQQTSDREQTLRFAIRAVKGSQLLIASTAGYASSTWFRKIVDQGRREVDAGVESRTCYFEWGAPEDADPSDPQVWADASPGFGWTVDLASIQSEHDAMKPRGEIREFQRGSLNMWVDSMSEPVIPWETVWARATKTEGEGPAGEVVLAVDAPPEHTWAYVVAASRDAVEVLHADAGLSWLREYVLSVWEKNRDVEMVVGAKTGPVAGLLDRLEDDGVVVGRHNLDDMRKGCSVFYEDVMSGGIRFWRNNITHLKYALAAAERKSSGAAWVWGRSDLNTNIATLIATTMAYYQASLGSDPIDYEYWAWQPGDPVRKPDDVTENQTN